MLKLSKQHNNGNEENLIKLTLILKLDINGNIEILSSKSKLYSIELLENEDEDEKIKRKIKYNSLTGVIYNRIKDNFNCVDINETSVYVGFRLNKNSKYDILMTPMAKNRVKIDMPIQFLDLIKIEYKTNNVFSYLGHFKIDKLREFTTILNDYKYYLEMK
jgi:hypothetical protein